MSCEKVFERGHSPRGYNTNNAATVQNFSMDFEWHTCAHVLLLLLGFLASVLLPFCPSLSMYAIWHYMHKFALHFLIAVRNLLAWISHIGVRPSLSTSNSRVGSISENIFYHFDNLILNFYGRILVIRQSNIFWYWHHPNEWDLAPTNDMHNKNTKISSFFEVYGGGRTCAAA